MPDVCCGYRRPLRALCSSLGAVRERHCALRWCGWLRLILMKRRKTRFLWLRPGLPVALKRCGCLHALGVPRRLKCKCRLDPASTGPVAHDLTSTSATTCHRTRPVTLKWCGLGPASTGPLAKVTRTRFQGVAGPGAGCPSTLLSCHLPLSVCLNPRAPHYRIMESQPPPLFSLLSPSRTLPLFNPLHPPPLPQAVKRHVLDLARHRLRQPHLGQSPQHEGRP